jgi:hypothetical protein
VGGYHPRVGIEDVRMLGVKGAQRADGSYHHRHGMGITAVTVQELLQLLVHHSVVRNDILKLR